MSVSLGPRLTDFYLSIRSVKEANKFEIKEDILLIDWLVENYKNYGTKLNIVTDKSQEGSQFCKGFGGIGGVLRYQLNLSNDGDDLGDQLEEIDENFYDY